MALFGVKRGQPAPVRNVTGRWQKDEMLALALADIDVGAINIVALDDKRRLGVVVLSDGAHRAFNLQCPHLGADLGDGTYCAKDGTLRCPWHGYLFEMAGGRFTRNPNIESLAKARVKGKNFDPDKTVDYRLRLYSAEASGDELHIELK